MKNLFKVFVIAVFTAVIVLSMTACGGAGAGGGGGGAEGDGGINIGPTNGQLTINGLGEFNGKYVHVQEVPSDPYAPPSVPFLLAIGYFQNEEPFYALISEGTAVLKIWNVTHMTETAATLVNYNGSDSKNMYVLIFETISPNEDQPISHSEIQANFSNGIATITW